MTATPHQFTPITVDTITPIMELPTSSRGDAFTILRAERVARGAPDPAADIDRAVRSWHRWKHLGLTIVVATSAASCVGIYLLAATLMGG